jgi:hypothetical protein
VLAQACPTHRLRTALNNYIPLAGGGQNAWHALMQYAARLGIAGVQHHGIPVPSASKLVFLKKPVPVTIASEGLLTVDLTSQFHFSIYLQRQFLDMIHAA